MILITEKMLILAHQSPKFKPVLGRLVKAESSISNHLKVFTENEARRCVAKGHTDRSVTPY